VDVGARVMLLERELGELILQWERFFSGDRRQPPQLDRERLTRKMRLLAERGARSRSVQFRFEQLQHRFAVYNALWDRQLREREEGRRTGAVRKILRPGPNAAPAGPVQQSGDGNGLYDRYVAARAALGQEMTLGKEQFEAQLERQRKLAESKLGGPVSFDVVVDGDKVKIAAKAVKGRNGGR